MALAGGLFYRPDNFDYLTYRLPRVLHWCWEHRWYWTGSTDLRLDISSTGFEWLITPFFVFFHTDRFFFLVNLVSYLFLPGLVFSVFRGLGISGRVGWWWMWILPTGFCYVLQAGGMGNDMFACVYFLGSLYFLLLAREQRPCRNLVLSCLCLALLTGAKPSNIPLVAPWLVIVFWDRKRLWAAIPPGILVGTAIVAILISFVPVALINIHATGSYTGEPANRSKLQLTSPLAGIIGNSIEIAVANLSPPVWTHRVNLDLGPPDFENYLHRNFPRFVAAIKPFQIEEGAGVGLGVTAFAAVGLIYGIMARFAQSGRRQKTSPFALWLLAATVVAWLGFMSKIGGEDSSRLVAVYYIIGIGAVLAVVGLDGTVIHRWLWKWVGYAAMAMVFPVLVLNPSRPMLPAPLIAHTLSLAGVPASSVAQLEENYRLRASRYDCFRDLLPSVPSAETAIGAIIGSDDLEVSLWLPFGSRQVVYLNPNRDSSARLKAEHVRFVIVSDIMLQKGYQMTIDGLLDQWSMTLVQKLDLTFKTGSPVTWYLIQATP